MRSGMTACVAPCSARTPSTVMRSVPAPPMRAPIAPRQRARSTTSGSRAAFSSDRGPVRERRRHQQVLGAGDGRHVEHEPRALEAPGGADVAVLQVDRRAHRLQALHVLVDRPQPDRAAAGQRHARLAAAREQRSEREDRRAHRLHELVRRQRPADAAGLEPDGAGRAHVERHAHLREQRFHRAHVVQHRHVGQRQRLLGQERGAEDRQRRVLGARRADLAFEAVAAFDRELIHARAPPIARASASASTARGSPRASGRRAPRTRAGAA